MPRKSKRKTRRRTRRKKGGGCLFWHPSKGAKYKACLEKKKKKKESILKHGYDTEGKDAKEIKKCSGGEYLDRVYNNLGAVSHLHNFPDYKYATGPCGPWRVGLIGCKREHGTGCKIEVSKDDKKRIIPIFDHSAILDADHVFKDGLREDEVRKIKTAYNKLNELTEEQIKAVTEETGEKKGHHGGRWPARSSGPTNKKGSRKKTKKKRTKNKTKKKRRKKRRRKRRR